MLQVVLAADGYFEHLADRHAVQLVSARYRCCFRCGASPLPPVFKTIYVTLRFMDFTTARCWAKYSDTVSVIRTM